MKPPRRDQLTVSSACRALVALSAALAVNGVGLVQSENASLGDAWWQQKEECLALTRAPALRDSCVSVSKGADDRVLWTTLAQITRDCIIDYSVPANQTGPAYDAFGLFWREGVTPYFESFLQQFFNDTGLRVGVKSRTIQEYIKSWLGVWPTAAEPGPNDFWVISAEVFGENVGRPENAFVDLTGLLIDDPSYHLADIPVGLRDAGSSAYAGSYSALPMWMTSYQLMYRRDIFEQYGIAVPRTWDEALAVAEQYGRGALGPGQPDLGFCFESNPDCGYAHAMFIYILATLVQLEGPSQGAWFDPETLDPLYTHPAAFTEALRLFLALKRHSVPDTNPCFAVYNMLASGRCLMLWGFSFAFKRASHSSSPMWGRQGVAQTPGSVRVLRPLDRRNPAARLVPCNPDLCPYATLDPVVVPTSASSASGSGPQSPLLVNHIVPLETASFAINVRAPLHRQAAAFAALHTFTGPEVHPGVMLQPSTEVTPLRTDELDEELWVNAGYHRADVSNFLRVYQENFDHGNVYYELRIPGVFQTYTLVYDMLWLAISGNYTSPEQLRTYLVTGTEQRVFATAGGRERLLPLYRRSVGYTPPPQDTEQRRSVAPETVLLAALVPAAAVLVAAGAALWGYLHWRRLAAEKRSRTRGAPGAGPGTTLLVTDIQDSTSLWESLPAEVVDAAVRLHHRIIREQLLRHAGYESATEGDSFVVAFHRCDHALAFALATQDALLAADWPQELLASPFAAPLVVRRDEAAAATIAARLAAPSLRDALTGEPAAAAAAAATSPPPPPQAATPRSLRPASLDLPRLTPAATAPPPAAAPFGRRPSTSLDGRFMPHTSMPTARMAAVLEGVVRSEDSGGGGGGGAAAAAVQPSPPPAVPMSADSPLPPECDDGRVRRSWAATAAGRTTFKKALLNGAASLQQVYGRRRTVDGVAGGGGAAAAAAAGGGGGGVAGRSRPAVSAHFRSTVSGAMLRGGGGGSIGGGQDCASCGGGAGECRTEDGGDGGGGDDEADGGGSATERLVEALGRLFPEYDTYDSAGPLGSGVVLFRGLRVRMGLHSGIAATAEVQYNRASGRICYPGPTLQLTKAVADAGHGGQITLTGAARRAAAAADGKALATTSAAAAATTGGAAGGGGSLPYVVLAAGSHVLKAGGSAVELYSVYGRGMTGRAGHLAALRTEAEKVPGVLAAPLGRVALAVAQVQDPDDYAGWGLEVSLQSHRAMLNEAGGLAAAHGGYLVPTPPGSFRAVFCQPESAVRWILELQDDLGPAVGPPPAVPGRGGGAAGEGAACPPQPPPPPGNGGGALVQPKSPSSTTGSADTGEAVNKLARATAAARLSVLYVKGGVEVGESLATLHAAAGSMSYAGGTAKRAACLAAHAAWHEVLASTDVVRAVEGKDHPALSDSLQPQQSQQQQQRAKSKSRGKRWYQSQLVQPLLQQLGSPPPPPSAAAATAPAPAPTAASLLPRPGSGRHALTVPELPARALSEDAATAAAAVRPEGVDVRQPEEAAPVPEGPPVPSMEHLAAANASLASGFSVALASEIVVEAAALLPSLLSEDQEEEDGGGGGGGRVYDLASSPPPPRPQPPSSQMQHQQQQQQRGQGQGKGPRDPPPHKAAGRPLAWGNELRSVKFKGGAVLACTVRLDRAPRSVPLPPPPLLPTPTPRHLSSPPVLPAAALPPQLSSPSPLPPAQSAPVSQADP